MHVTRTISSVVSCTASSQWRLNPVTFPTLGPPLLVVVSRDCWLFVVVFSICGMTDISVDVGLSCMNGALRDIDWLGSTAPTSSSRRCSTMQNFEILEKSWMFTNLKMFFFKFVKNPWFSPIFHCFECYLYLYSRGAFICGKSLQTLYVCVSIKHRVLC